jgi:hypothetical protein
MPCAPCLEATSYLAVWPNMLRHWFLYNHLSNWIGFFFVVQLFFMLVFV